MDSNIQRENHQHNAPPSDKLAFSNRVPLTDVPLHYGTVLHIAALPSDKKIDTKLVHQLLGVGTHSPEKIADEIRRYSDCKHYVRSWAALSIKKKIIAAAKVIPDSLDTVEIRHKGDVIYSFAELLRWWDENCEEPDIRYFNSVSYVCHNDFEPGWEVTMEQEFMRTFKWSYLESSSRERQDNCKRSGFTMKGCIAKNISNVKCEMMKQLNMVGKKKGVSISKVRPKEKAWNESGKYMRKKKDVYVPTYCTHLTQTGIDTSTASVIDRSDEHRGKNEVETAIKETAHEVKRAKKTDLLVTRGSIDTEREHHAGKETKKRKQSKKKTPTTPPPPYERSEYEELNYQRRLRNEQRMKDIMAEKNEQLQRSLDRIAKEAAQKGEKVSLACITDENSITFLTCN